MKPNYYKLIAIQCGLFAVMTARAATIEYTASLSGPQESPPNASTGTGLAEVTFDDTANTLRVVVSFSGLVGNTIASHIHAPTLLPFTGTAGVATTTPTFPNFPLGVTSGTYDQTFDLSSASSYNPAFVTANGSIAAAEATLLAALNSGESYLNIHTSFKTGGEIRGFLTRVPETNSTAVLLGFAVIAMFVMAPKRKESCPALCQARK